MGAQWNGPKTQAEIEALGYEFDSNTGTAILGRCRSCSELITWVLTPTRKRMPLHIAGNRDGAILFDVHFATCPGAVKHRRPKEPKPTGRRSNTAFEVYRLNDRVALTIWPEDGANPQTVYIGASDAQDLAEALTAFSKDIAAVRFGASKLPQATIGDRF